MQSTQRDGMLTVDQALVKQAWERVSNRVREAPSTFSEKHNIVVMTTLFAKHGMFEFHEFIFLHFPCKPLSETQTHT